MSTDTESSELRQGAIGWMAHNSVAANLLMLVLLLGGLLGLPRLKQEVFPEFALDLVSIAVPYPGASPTEVEQGIVLAVEEAVRGVEGVKRVTSVASEGAGSVSVELLLEADPDKVLADVKAEVDRITTFPLDAEEPQVVLASRRNSVVSLVLAGDLDRNTLHGLAEEARAALIAHPGVTQVDVEGLPPLELAIEISPVQLEGLGLTLDDVARQVAASSLELPGGTLRTEGGELLVRVSDRARSVSDFAKVRLRGTRDGAEILLGDVATLVDTFEEEDLRFTYNGQPAVRVRAFRVGNETPSQVAAAVREVAEDLRGRLPDTVKVELWDDDSKLLDERIDLLLRNAISGLLLVLGVLALFLEPRLAFWVALGIPISFLGALILLPSAGISINMISLFAFIVTLGIVVDDAIVVSEEYYERIERGASPMEAAVQAARSMSVAVTFSVLTTVAAFAPLLTVPGVSGKLFRILPIIVILVLLLSLFESFFILPSHLGHRIAMPALLDRALAFLLFPVNLARDLVGRLLSAFSARLYGPVLRWALQLRYLTTAASLALFILAIGTLASGFLPFSFFPVLEGNLVTASVRLPYGSSTVRTEAVLAQLQTSLDSALNELDGQQARVATFAQLGRGPATGGPAPTAGATGGHLATVEVELVSPDERSFSADQLAAAWQKAMPDLAGIEAISFISSFGPGAGAAVDVQLSHRDTEVLEAASQEMTEILRAFPDLKNVTNSFAAGKPQLDLSLLPEAATLGLTANEVARQVRGAYFGAEAIREQRGRNEIKVRARFPKEDRTSEFDLEELRVRTPAGGYVPLQRVATVDRGRAPTSIQREEGLRILHVTAELASGARSSGEVLESLTEKHLPRLRAKYPGLDADFAGQQREQAETNASLGRSYFLALFVMYALLAIPLRSYVQPVVVMAAIPMGLVGAVIGHLVMGFELSIISTFGIVALSGVAVNDSLVLVDAANTYRAEGAEPNEAVWRAGVRRLRPILLTSLTTFFGLAPMIAETSLQARFLIPMAISLGFGVIFSTFVTLLLVPSLYLIVEDGVGAARRLFQLGQRAPLPTEA